MSTCKTKNVRTHYKIKLKIENNLHFKIKKIKMIDQLENKIAKMVRIEKF